jgi:hypothetical protein
MGLFTNVAARPCPDPECSEGEGSASLQKATLKGRGYMWYQILNSKQYRNSNFPNSKCRVSLVVIVVISHVITSPSPYVILSPSLFVILRERRDRRDRRISSSLRSELRLTRVNSATEGSVVFSLEILRQAQNDRNEGLRMTVMKGSE